MFTGAKRPHQNEASGGIIADEMGLGKSLVILSTIASSMDRANEFVAAETELQRTKPNIKIPSKASLILAPSSRKSSSLFIPDSLQLHANIISVLIDSWVDEIRKHVHTVLWQQNNLLILSQTCIPRRSFIP